LVDFLHFLVDLGSCRALRLDGVVDSMAVIHDPFLCTGEVDTG
jgi:hypothetical protein